MFTVFDSLDNDYVSFINNFIPTKNGKYIRWQDIVNIEHLTKCYIGEDIVYPNCIDYDLNTRVLYYSNHPIYNIDGSVKTIDSENIDLNKYKKMKETISPLDVYNYDLLMRNHEESCNIIEKLLKLYSDEKYRSMQINEK